MADVGFSRDEAQSLIDSLKARIAIDISNGKKVPSETWQQFKELCAAINGADEGDVIAYYDDPDVPGPT